MYEDYVLQLVMIEHRTCLLVADYVKYVGLNPFFRPPD